ncbi:MAG: hypothetical protein AB7G87_12685 [Clostridia bacterium]
MILSLKEIVQKVILSQAFITVIAGVGVFALSQWIIITVINPYQNYFRAASDLSREMLKLTHRYTNFDLTGNEQETIRDVNAAYLSAVWNSGWIGRRRRRVNGFKVAQCVNGMIYSSHPSATGVTEVRSIEDVALIEELDPNLKIQYRATSREKTRKFYSARKKR